MMEYIYFNSRDELLRLRITEIAYFESDGNYCNVVTANKLRSPIGMNLTNLEHAGSPDKPGGLSIQLCKSEKKEFYIRYSS